MSCLIIVLSHSGDKQVKCLVKTGLSSLEDIMKLVCGVSSVSLGIYLLLDLQ